MNEKLSASNYLYNKNLKSKAAALRATMTKAEACLWKYVLQGRRMKGFQFRRQRPILKYIADFMCKELNLIIEVDGITHTYEDVAKNDQIRQQALEYAGFTVLRFTDEEVLGSIDRVQSRIENWIDDKKIHPQPPPAGDMDTKHICSTGIRLTK